MTETTTRPGYTEHLIWDNEAFTYYVEGHVKPERRAIAAVNHWARDTCGLVNLADEKGFPVEDVSVSYGWVRPDPQAEGDDETAAWCDEDHPEAKPVTTVVVL